MKFSVLICVSLIIISQLGIAVKAEENMTIKGYISGNTLDELRNSDFTAFHGFSLIPFSEKEADRQFKGLNIREKILFHMDEVMVADDSSIKILKNGLNNPELFNNNSKFNKNFSIVKLVADGQDPAAFRVVYTDDVETAGRDLKIIIDIEGTVQFVSFESEDDRIVKKCLYVTNPNRFICNLLRKRED